MTTPPKTRLCRKCGETKPLDEFKKSKSCHFGRCHMCKPCDAKARAASEQEKTGKREWRLKREAELAAAEFGGVTEAEVAWAAALGGARFEDSPRAR